MGSGNYFYPLKREFLNLSGGTVTGNTLFTANLSAATIYSGSTNLSDLLNNVVSGGTRISNGINTFTAGTFIVTSVNITGGSFNNLYTSGETQFFQASATSLSGGTIFSGSTPLSTIINNSITAITSTLTSTRVQNGLNTYTGGTADLPTVNISAATLNYLSATTLSGGTILSGSTNLYSIFQQIGTDVQTAVQPGSNINTAGTVSVPIISVVSSPFFNNLTLSGTGLSNAFSANTLSGGTIFSGSTPLINIIVSQITAATSSLTSTRVQNGLNTYTGGTADLPTVNISGATLNSLTVSGNTSLQETSATALSANTFYSGSTDINAFFNQDRAQINTKANRSGDTFTGQINAPSLSANTLSGGTIYSGSTDLYNIFTQGSGTVNTLPLWVGTKTLGNSIISQVGTGITVNGSVNILGNVDILGTATTINTQIIQSLDNNILLNYSGNHISAIGGGITVLSGQPSGVASVWATDANGNWSANTQINATNGLDVSNGALQSGGTNLYSIFDPLGSGVQSVGQGSNIITGGTSTNPIISTVSSPAFNNITISGTGIANAFSANTLSGGTIFSGSTPLSTIINNSITAVTSTLTSTRVQDGLNTYTGGTADLPTVNVSALTVNTIVASGNSSFTTLSANTYYSGSTLLSSVIVSLITGTTSAITSNIQNGLNTYTGGTSFLPTVNISAATLDNLIVSGGTTLGTLSATTISGGTLYSGSTNLYDIFATVPDQNDITRVQPGTNTYTGGTPNNPTVNVSALTINSITASGGSNFSTLSATTLSASTYFSGSTSLTSIISSLITGVTSGITGSQIQNGLNTYTGGTNSLPTVNISAATLNSLVVSGNTILGSVSASTVSGGTFYGNGSGLTGLLSYITGATSVGQGFSLYNSVSGQNINIKSLTPGSGITIIDSGDTLVIHNNFEILGTLREGASLDTTGSTSQIINTITGITGGSYVVESYVTAYNGNSEYGMWKRILGVYHSGGTPVITYEKADFDKQNDGLSPVSIFYSPTTGGTIDIIVSGSSSAFSWKSYHEVIDEGANNVFDVSHYSSFGLTIDGAGLPITTGHKGYVTIPYSATIYGWDLIGNTTGTCVVDLWKTTIGSFPPTSANTITGSQTPTLSNQMINRNDSLTGWTTTTINVNDILAFTVLTASTVSRVNLTIKTIKI